MIDVSIAIQLKSMYKNVILRRGKEVVPEPSYTVGFAIIKIISYLHTR